MAWLSSALGKPVPRFLATLAAFNRNQLARLNIKLLVFNNFPFVVVVFTHDIATIWLLLFKWQYISHYGCK